MKDMHIINKIVKWNRPKQSNSFRIIIQYIFLRSMNIESIFLRAFLLKLLIMKLLLHDNLIDLCNVYLCIFHHLYRDMLQKREWYAINYEYW